jgi:hypothetical protein
MRPKFEVGEVVILQSKSLPEHNGEYVIAHCSVAPIDSVIEYKGSYYRHIKQSVAYFLDGPLDHKGDDIFWSESALRKKHIPGELNFTDLMASLSSPKLITHDH